MCDFDDDFGDDGFMDDDSSEDSFEENCEAEDSFEEDPEMDDADSHEDDFNAKDAFYIGSIVGGAYEEGLDERKRRELLKEKKARSR
jgi:hypothetical protein